MAGAAFGRCITKGGPVLGAGITEKNQSLLEMLPVRVRERIPWFPLTSSLQVSIVSLIGATTGDWQNLENVASRGPCRIEQWWGMHVGASKRTISTHAVFPTQRLFTCL